MNRATVKSYSDGTPTERFCYDGTVLSGTTCVTPGSAIPFSIGRLTVSNSVYNQRTVNAFDAMGRVLSDTQSTVTVDSPWTTENYTFSYTYHRNGSLASQTYPSGKVINYTYDTNNRPDTVSESGGEAFILGSEFAGHGGVEEIRFGNLLRQKYCFNDRLQMTGTELSRHSTPYGTAVDCVQVASNLITLNFDYGSANHNNGNIVGQTIEASADDVWQQYYTYDGTNRLAMASENAAITGSNCPGGATWCQKYGYDHFGNRWIAASLDTLHMATPTAQSAVSLATNRLTSGTYDAAGNLTAQTYITTGGGSMAYDANNKMTSFTATGVSVATKYDSAGRRVRKIYNTKTTIWVYDAFGKLAAEYTTETQTTPVGTYYRTTDHLGSTRLVTDDQGRVRQRHDFFPFGEQIPASSSFGNRQDIIDGGFATYNASLSVRQQFTGQQRDEEAGLDYFWERCFCAELGRFFSVDPNNAGAALGSPTSWNAYSYGNNNPMRFIDPDGRVWVDVSGTWVWDADLNFGISVGGDAGMAGWGESLVQWGLAYALQLQQAASGTGNYDGTLRAMLLLGHAVQSALEALENDDCRKLFKDPERTKKTLEELSDSASRDNTQSATGGFKIKWEDMGNQGPTAGVGTAGNIKINTTSGGHSRYWNTATNSDENAHTLLHEIMHKGQAASGIGWEDWDGDFLGIDRSAQQAYNNWLIDTNCFNGTLGYPKPQANGGVRGSGGSGRGGRRGTP